MTRPEIQRALRFVAENLEQPITVAEVAKAAHLSEFHLHRVRPTVTNALTKPRLNVS